MDHKLMCKAVKCLLKTLLGLVSGSRKRVLRHNTKSTEKKLINWTSSNFKSFALPKTLVRG